MKFSIVTPSLNCAAYIARNIRSVREQNCAPGELEHWIIDGGSTDGTIEILKREPDIKWISEKDDGLPDAVNKGIKRSNGEWIIWLNADDALAPGALRIFLDEERYHPECAIFCGAQKVFDYEERLEAVTPGWDYDLRDLIGKRTAIIQASTFVHRRVYDQVGLLDTTFRYAMDYEWVVRAMQSFACRPIDAVLTYYYRRRGSIMDKGIAGQHREFLRVRRMYHKSPWNLAELRLRFYLATDFLRRNHKLRACIRRIKTWLGYPPSHPAS